MPFRSIEDPSSLRRVLEAVLLIEADLSLPELLRHIVEEAVSMTGATYGALGVLNAEGTALAEFLTVGLTTAQEEQIGARPVGLGVLGLLIEDPRPLRITAVGGHASSSGFPSDHPPMTSFLGVPIKVRNEVYGNLYLTDKLGWSEFTSNDQALVESLAIAAGVAIENARLHTLAAQSAILADRDRLARDLHDTIIQRMFSIGLTIQSVAGTPIPEPASKRLTDAVTEIDETIRQLRSTIFELGLDDAQAGVRASILALLDDLRSVVGFSIRATFDGAVDSVITRIVADQLLPTLREAITNIEKHAQASAVTVLVKVEDGTCQLQVSDNGSGIPSRTPRDGHGLNNMRRRAEKLHGEFNVVPRDEGGTELNWIVPLS